MLLVLVDLLILEIRYADFNIDSRIYSAIEAHW